MSKAAKKEGARRGPKPKGPYEGKHKTITTRVTEATREKLEASAKASGRSLSQEIELALERSLASERLETSLVEVHKAVEEFRRAKENDEWVFLSVLWRQNDLALSELAIIRKLLEASGPPELVKNATAGNALGAALGAAGGLDAAHERLSEAAGDPLSLISELRQTAAAHREMADRLDAAAEQTEALGRRSKSRNDAA